MDIGHRKLCRIARAFLATRQTNREFSTWVMAYADPTGETAVWNWWHATGSGTPAMRTWRSTD